MGLPIQGYWPSVFIPRMLREKCNFMHSVAFNETRVYSSYSRMYKINLQILHFQAARERLANVWDNQAFLVKSSTPPRIPTSPGAYFAGPMRRKDPRIRQRSGMALQLGRRSEAGSSEATVRLQIEKWYGLNMLGRLGQPIERISPEIGPLLPADWRDRD